MSALTLAFLLLLGPGEQADELSDLESVIDAALEKISPSVVTIKTVGGVRQVNIPERFREKMSVPERPRDEAPRRPRDPDEEEEEEGGGDEQEGGRTPRFRNEWQKMLAMPGFKKAEGPTTGVIVSSNGHIITSAWNFDSKPQAVVVTLADGSVHAARLLGVDRAAGLAMIRIEAEGLQPARFLDPKSAREGSWAFAIGRSLAKDSVTIKYGIISARNRVNGRALQTDAATSPSNYGGPLIDLEGNVFGIIVPLGARGESANPNWYDSGIGFAVPVPDPARLVERLGGEGVELKPAFLGVQMDQDNPKPGAHVTEVTEDGPAAKAGLKKGDVVTAIDGDPVRNAFTLRFALGRRRAGDKVKLTVHRGEETLELEATLGERMAPTTTRERLPVPMPGEPKRGRGQGGDR
jgi:S1-C subfamily serine protease